MLEYKSKSLQKIFKKNKKFTWLTNQDIEKIRIWRNQQLYILRQNKKINSKNQKKYFKNFFRTNCKSKKPLNILFAIKEKNQLIGYGGLVHISWENKRAEISFLTKTSINESKIQYEKHMKDFFKFVINLSFTYLKLKKIYTETFTFRNLHIKIIEKLGFKKEGLLKQQYIKKNKKISSVLHAKFK